jgi:hypothetical protein
MQNQKQAVRNAITSVSDYVLNSEAIASEYLSDSQKAEIKQILFNGFKANEIACSESFKHKIADDSYLKRYVSGLLNNWLRKDLALNAGKPYEAKNPGSRANASDPQLKALRQLIKQCAEADKPSVQQAIDARIAELKPTIEINVDALPDSLKHLVK